MESFEEKVLLAIGRIEGQMSFVNKRGTLRKLLRGMARLTSFWLPWCDRFLISRLGAYDGASGFYFMGRKAPEPITDRDLLSKFRGVR